MIRKDEIIDEIYNAFKDQEIKDGDFLEGLLTRLPLPWLKTELNYLVQEKEPVRIHQMQMPTKKNPNGIQHPWRGFGSFNFARRANRRAI